MVEIASFASFFDEHIVDTHKLPAFIYLLFFLGTFAFIRTSAHMIRAQVSWWPGNVEVGGTHIHHLVWGILLLMLAGWVGIVVAPEPPGREIVAAVFGIGTGLTLDEFALWLELKDVYWSADGRKSIDAVIVAGIIASFGVLGFTIWVDAADDVAVVFHALIGLTIGGLLVAVVAALHSFPDSLLIWLVAFIAYQQLQDRVVQPLLYGRAVNVNPLIAILVLFAGAQISGILGALLAIPVAASIAVVFKVFQDPESSRATP